MKNDIHQLLKEGKITMKTIDRVKSAKSYIEKKYSLKRVKEEEKKKEWEIFNLKLEELNLSIKEKENIKKDVFHKEAEFLRLKRKKITIKDFESIAIIGRGAFGEVRVCRHIESSEIVAIKKMRKEDMLSKNQLLHVRTEREILTNSKIPWIVNLKYSFQDESFLYLVMDFLSGGDFMSLLMKKDILNEEESRFYIAELILAVESVHNLNCIHRDLKPDNILIDINGHIKLSDFGLSKLGDQTFYPMTDGTVNEDKITNITPSNLSNTQKMSRLDIKDKRKNRLLAYSTVGTPDYIAPEVFNQQGYGLEVDWWSVGVILFEMMVGYPPFFSENPSDTCQKIVKWKQFFSIPIDANLSPEAENIIRRLICPAENRLGYNGADEIKKHPFFKGFNWENVRNTKAPFIPDVKSSWDTKYFDTFTEQDPFYPPEKKNRRRKDINYPGYTYNRDLENYRGGLLHALEVLDTIKQSTNDTKEKTKIVDELDEKNIKSDSQDGKYKLDDTIKLNRDDSKIYLESKLNKISNSPESRNIISGKNITINSSINGEKKTIKPINVIPLKALNSARDHYFNSNHTNDITKFDRFSPKQKDTKIPTISPRQKLAPVLQKSDKTLQESKSNKIYKELTGNINNKSTSPKHMFDNKKR